MGHAYSCGRGDARDVVVRLAGFDRPAPETLDRLYVASDRGALTPMRQVASVRFEAGAPEIRDVERERAVTVTSSCAPDSTPIV